MKTKAHHDKNVSDPKIYQKMLPSNIELIAKWISVGVILAHSLDWSIKR